MEHWPFNPPFLILGMSLVRTLLLSYDCSGSSWS
jgi:hypothetical protein